MNALNPIDDKDFRRLHVKETIDPLVHAYLVSVAQQGRIPIRPELREFEARLALCMASPSNREIAEAKGNLRFSWLVLTGVYERGGFSHSLGQ